MPTKLVFLIGDFFISSDFSLIKDLQNKYQQSEYEISVFTILTETSIYQKAVAYCNDYNWNNKTILYDNSVTLDNKIGSGAKKISLHTEHKFIDICLKAIQIEKPDIIIISDKIRGTYTAAMNRNILAHAHEIGCIVLTN